MATLPPPIRPSGFRRICKRSLFSSLRNREAGMHLQAGSGRPNINWATQRQVTWNLVPDTTFYDLRMPNGCQQLHFRKFSGDGKYLVAFGKSNHSLVLLRYLGPGCPSVASRRTTSRSRGPADTSSSDRSSSFTSASEITPSARVGTSTNGFTSSASLATAAENERSQASLPSLPDGEGLADQVGSPTAFSDFFAVEYEINVTAGTEVLCKEFSMFTEDGKFLILASAVPSSTPPAQDSRTSIQQLDDVTFWIVEISSGTIADRRTFKSDYIYLSNHAGVSLMDTKLLITSVQHQAAYVLEIMPSGRLNHTHSIGPDVFPNDNEPIGLLSLREKEWRRAAESLPSVRTAPQHQLQLSQTTEVRLRPVGGVLGKRQRAEEDDREDATDIQPPSTSGFRPVKLFGPRRPTVPSITAVSSTSDLLASTPTITSGATSPPGAWSPAWTTGTGSRPTTRRLVPVDAIIPAQTSPTSTPTRSLLRDESASDDLLPGLKQRLMAHLHRLAVASGDPARLRYFYLSWDYFSSLVMWRCEWMDQDTIVFKMGAPDSVGKSDPPPTAATFLMVVELSSGKILGFHDSCSPDLLDWYERDDRWRRQAAGRVNWCGSLANSERAREAVRRAMFSLWKAKNGGSHQAIKRALANVPHNPQSYSESPYWDQELFSYDERTIGPLERPKVAIDFPYKFFNRVTGEYAFTIDPFPTPYGVGPVRSKHYAALLFHPTDPFCLTVMYQSQQQATINIHARRCVG
ncbi:acid phosphatase det1 [Gonapodya sp. JEL0774]|nr:acid phosphatase det1 [Gonapodya sp. JEL0774]